MNDRFTQRLGGLLQREADSIGEGPRFTPDDIVRGGRAATRRRARRAWAGAGVTAVAVALALVAAPAAVGAVWNQLRPPATASKPAAPPVRALPRNCLVQRLPVPARSVMDMVTAMDPTGRYIVGRSNPGGDQRMDVLIWNNGELRSVQVPGDNQLPTAVNAAGVVAGVTGAIPNDHAWVYRDGTVTNLQGQQPSYASAINDSGVVVGWDGAQRPVMWRTPSSQPVALPTPDGAWQGMANGISANGTIVGELAPASTNAQRPYVWLPNGTTRELPLPTIAGTKAVTARATSISGDWVAGIARDAREDVPTRWNLRTGEVQTFEQITLWGNVSADGWLVGNNRQGQASIAGTDAAVTLPDLDNHNNVMANLGVAISGDGQVVAGDASTGGEHTEPVTWHCG
jgi:hypothetical protein